MNKYFVIGDIHGCIKQLDEILDIKKNYPEHTLVFLGDYIDRGPESDKVCKRVSNLNAICLSGNHEVMLLERIKKYPAQRKQTLTQAGISEISINWIEHNLVNIYEDNDYIFVHAGLDITKNIKDQTHQDYLWTVFDGDYFTITKKTIVHGHVIIKEPVVVGNRININTGCGNGGCLTGIVLPEMILHKSSISSGKEYNWEEIRRALEEGIEELEIQNG